MKLSIKTSWCIILSICISCIEDINPDLDSFVKILGEEQASTGRKIIELSNGDFMLLGKIGEPAFDFSDNGSGISTGKITEEASGIIITDKNGNLKISRSYPISSLDLGTEFQFFNIESNASFTDAVELADGSFYVSGQWRDIDIYWQKVNQTFNSTPTSSVTAPFLMKLTSNLEVEFLKVFNGGPDSDGDYHAFLDMKLTSSGELIVMLGFFLGTELSFKGYSLLRFDDQGLKDTYDFVDVNNLRFTKAFDIDNKGNIVLIGQVNDNIVLFEKSSIESNLEKVHVLGPDGQNGFNTNLFYIEALDEGGYVMVYTDPTDIIYLDYFDDGFSRVTRVDISVLRDEYPRAMIRTVNGDILIYSEHLTQNDVSTQGYLYRYALSGNRFNQIFRVLIEGKPGDVIESSDGSIIVLSSPVYNDVFPKMTLTKLSVDGTLF